MTTTRRCHPHFDDIHSPPPQQKVYELNSAYTFGAFLPALDLLPLATFQIFVCMKN